MIQVILCIVHIIPGFIFRLLYGSAGGASAPLPSTSRAVQSDRLQGGTDCPLPVYAGRQSGEPDPEGEEAVRPEGGAYLSGDPGGIRTCVRGFSPGRGISRFLPGRLRAFGRRDPQTGRECGHRSPVPAGSGRGRERAGDSSVSRGDGDRTVQGGAAFSSQCFAVGMINTTMRITC